MYRNFREVYEAAQNCQACALAQTRKNVVFGEGSAKSGLMFIGEGPGEWEDKTGRPFVGPAGQLLDKMIAAIDLKREDVYIANIVKCRPPGNRDPQPQEQDACFGWLERQLRLLQPSIIVCLGRISASRGSMASGSSGTACAILPCIIPPLCCGTRRAARRHTRTC